MPRLLLFNTRQGAGAAEDLSNYPETLNRW